MALTQVQGGMILPSTTLTTPIVATTMGVGGATAASSGAGITFPATQSASTDANTLDDYEEGTWTPAIDSASNGTGRVSTVYSAQYTKVGRIVTVNCFVQLATLGSGGSGTWIIKNLPFTSLSDSANYHSTLSVGYFSGLATNVYYIGGTVQPNSNFLQMRGTGAPATGTSDLAFSTFVQAGTGLILTAVYQAAA